MAAHLFARTITITLTPYHAQPIVMHINSIHHPFFIIAERAYGTGVSITSNLRLHRSTLPIYTTPLTRKQCSFPFLRILDGLGLFLSLVMKTRSSE
jgi:hypothetical protein